MKTVFNKNKNTAVFSPCRKYRYMLWRTWDHNLPIIAFIGVNPSTADETIDDPTISKCIQYSRNWGYGKLIMLNLFAYRSTDPEKMKKAKDPIGPQNDVWLTSVYFMADKVVAAWGNNGQHLNRDQEILKLFPDLHVLTLTSRSCPGHPLYLPMNLKPVLWKRGKHV